MKYLWISLGGALGALSRYLVGLWIYERLGTQFPYGTFVVNLTGCFLIGLISTVLRRAHRNSFGLEIRRSHRVHRCVHDLFGV